MHRLFLTGAALVAVALTASAQISIDSKVPDFTLQDPAAGTVSFSSLKGDVTVVTFIATACPVSNAYNERMKALYADYSGRGVQFVFINSNSTEPGEEVLRHIGANGFRFKVYKDEGNLVADRFGAQVTPEVYVIDKSGSLRYHGSIDDSRDAANIKAQSLRNALDALLSGKAVETATTKAFGCTIKRSKKTT